MKPRLIFSLILGGMIFLESCQTQNQILPRASTPMEGILFVSERDGNREIYRIQPDGSELTRLTDHPSVDSDPDWSPDATQIAFRSRREGSSDIFIMGADGSKPFNLIRDPTDSVDDEFAPKWNPDGSILAIYTDRFQPPMGNCEGGEGVHHLGFIALENPEILGNPEIIQHFDDLPGEQQSFGWSADGSTLAISSVCSQNRQTYLWNRETHDVVLLMEGTDGVTNPAFSPDGRYLAFSSDRDQVLDIYIMELETGEIRNLTNSLSMDKQPTWSPDSSWIAFTSNRDGNDEIYVMDLSGENLQNITQHPGRDMMPAWSPAEEINSP